MPFLTAMVSAHCSYMVDRAERPNRRRVQPGTAVRRSYSICTPQATDRPSSSGPRRWSTFLDLRTVRFAYCWRSVTMACVLLHASRLRGLWTKLLAKEVFPVSDAAAQFNIHRCQDPPVPDHRAGRAWRGDHHQLDLPYPVAKVIPLAGSVRRRDAGTLCGQLTLARTGIQMRSNRLHRRRLRHKFMKPAAGHARRAVGLARRPGPSWELPGLGQITNRMSVSAPRRSGRSPSSKLSARSARLQTFPAPSPA